MSNILVLDDTVKNPWRVKREGTKWEAWIYDPSDEATGAPLFESYDFDVLVDKIRIFELSFITAVHLTSLMVKGIAGMVSHTRPVNLSSMTVGTHLSTSKSKSTLSLILSRRRNESFDSNSVGNSVNERIQRN